MGNLKNVTKIVTWKPYRYAVRWAHVPEDVPEWDISRGFHPKDYVERMGLKHLGITDAEAFVDDISQKFEQRDVLDAPNSGYPRVVAAKSILEPDQEPKVRCVEAIAKLTKHFDDEQKLKHHILEIASVYGPLETEGRPNNLIAWREAAKHAKFYLTLAEWVRQEIKKPEAERSSAKRLLELARLPSHLRGGTGYRYAAADFALLIIPMKFGDDDVVNDLFPGEKKTINRYKKLASGTLDFPNTAASLQSEFHGLFQREFEGDVQLKLKDGKLIYRQGCKVQMYCELAEAFSNNVELRACKTCGATFFPRNKKQEYCDLPGKSNCRRMAVYYKNRNIP